MWHPSSRNEEQEWAPVKAPLRPGTYYTRNTILEYIARGRPHETFRLGPSSIHPRNHVFTSIRIRTFLIPSPYQDKIHFNNEYSRYKDYRSTSEQRNTTITPLTTLKKHARWRALSPGCHMAVQMTGTESTPTNASHTMWGAGGVLVLSSCSNTHMHWCFLIS